MSQRDTPDAHDPSNGWEAVAAELIASRQRSRIGQATIRTWARGLPAGASILDLGCGSGVPVSEALIENGLAVTGVDASPTLVAAFRERFPQAAAVCEPVERSAFFGRTFDGIVAIGLLFLLPADTQRDLIRKLGAVLRPGGQLLFTSPAQRCTWTDLMTGRMSVSLGAEKYAALLTEAGLRLTGTCVDEGGNYYYAAART